MTLAKLIYEDLKRLSGLGKKRREPTLQKQIARLIKATGDALELKTKNQLERIVIDVNTINKKLSQISTVKDFEIVGKLKSDLDEINKSIVENQKVIDGFLKNKTNEQN